ncbi:MAG: ammonium transporter, partial [Alphaproteobacteria bacterium]|nr:ammonium transporter [Alphaproteobacteria bacterium]
MLKCCHKRLFPKCLLVLAILLGWLALQAGTALAQTAAAAAPATADSGHTAWMLVSTALVLLMLLPGLSLFYAGMVRRENALATLAQCFTACCVVSLIWVTIGYSLAFTSGNSWIGGLDRALMHGLNKDSLSGTIPESVFMMFQLTFALITPAILIG